MNITDTIMTTYRVGTTIPVAYRLLWKKNGQLVLQGQFTWEEIGPKGRSGGSEWRDIPSVCEETDAAE